MLKRYTMWKITDDVTDRDLLMHNLDYNLKALVGVAEGLESVKLVKGLTGTSHDIMIVSEFADEIALANFKADIAYNLFAQVYIQGNLINPSILMLEE